MSEHELRNDVAAACQILHSNGHDHFYLGHVSARGPADRVLVKPSGLGLGEVTPDDVVVADLQGGLLEGSRGLHHEMPIHTGIYAARPDVGCVIHTHPPYASGFAASDSVFKLVSQDSVLFLGEVGYYDSAELVVTAEQGANLARSLGAGKVVVLRNHGIAVAAETVAAAVVLALSFERSLRVQHTAGQFGPVREISEQEATKMRSYFDSQYGGRQGAMWDYLLRERKRPE